jgi:autotransporter-associated beta strand protein
VRKEFTKSVRRLCYRQPESRGVTKSSGANRARAKASLAFLVTTSLVALVAVTPAQAQTLINTDTVLTNPTDGGKNPGYFVTGGAALTVNGGTLQNFTTSGGSGSGGGAGLGGAIFIDSGSSVTLNGVSVLHNTVTGGVGGTNSQFGGTLNNGIANNPTDLPAVVFDGTAPTLTGLKGADGVPFPGASTDPFIFGDGHGNGIAGIGALNGLNAVNGFGGLGGAGGAGSNGWSSNPVASMNVAIATQSLLAAGLITGTQAAQIIALTVGSIAEIGSSLNPFEDPLAPITGITSGLLAIIASVNLGADVVSLAANVQALTSAALALESYTHAQSTTPATTGNGGNGENGGNGGKGSFGFGGGGGGAGGAYGFAALPNSFDGTGGNGGNGGAGGFGGGGGAGGEGFGANMAGCGSSTLAAVVSGCTSLPGFGGAGGLPGFGAGVGSNGGVTGDGVGPIGGGGGDGYGGAIFVNSNGKLTLTGTATFDGNSAVGGASLNFGPAGGSAGSDIFMMTGSTVLIAPGAGNVITFNGTIADNSVASIGAPSLPLGAGVIGTPSFPLGANSSAGAGAGVTTYAGLTVFNGQNTYSGQTVINGGALDGTLNTGTNTPGAPNYALTDGALQAADGRGLPTQSNLNFSGPNQFTGGVLQTSGTFARSINTNPNPSAGGTTQVAGGVQWTGSGGFAAIDAPLTVILNGGGLLAWGSPGFVPFGYSLIFGSANSNNMVTFTNAIDISGGTASILVANNGIPTGSVATMSGVISGSGNLSVGGGGFNGALNLTAVNTYTGTTIINSGTLAVGGTGSIASSSAVINNGTFDISLTTVGYSIANLQGPGNIALGAQTLTVTGNTTISGVIADGGIGGGTSGNLVAGGGTLTLSGVNTYTGTTSISTGATLALIGTGSIANSSGVIDNGIFDISQVPGAAITTLSGSGHVNLGADLLAVTAGSTTFSGVIGDGGIGGGAAGTLAVIGGTQTLSGINTYTGATLIGGGATLALSGIGSIANSAFVFDNGTFDISQTTTGASITTLMGAGNVALGTKALTVAAGSTTFSGVIGGGAQSSLIVSGGTQTLSGTNTYVGTTSIGAGATLALIGTGSIANSSGVIDNGSFDISQTSAGAAITTLSGSGQVNLGAQLLMVTAGSTTFSGVIADGGIGGGTAGRLAVTGGTQTLSGINTYTGGTLIGGGATLALSSSGSIASSAFVIDNGNFDISQTATGSSITTLTGAGNVALGAKALTVAAGSTTFAGVITDGGIGGGTLGRLIVGGGTQTLSGINTYTGTTSISGGATLALSGAGAIANSAGVIDNGTFDVSQVPGAAITTLSGSGLVNLGAQFLTITAGSTTFSGVIADGGIGGGTAGMLGVTGGTQTLSGINTYTGVSGMGIGATLALSGTGSIASSASVFDSGTFDISQTTAGASIITLMGGGNVALGAKALTVTTGSTTFAGVIADGGIGGGTSGGLIIGGGTQTLSGINTYTGTTSISSGATLALFGTGSIANSSGVIDNGTFDIAQTSGAAITTLSGSGLVNLGAQLLMVTAGSTTFSGVIADGGIGGGTAGMLGVTGGTQTLSGINSYTGGTFIGAGATLALSGAGSIANSAVVFDSGTFDVAQTTAGASITTLMGGGSVVLGSQFLTLTAAAAGPDGTLPAGIFSGVISGLGGVTITGGHEELTGVNTYFGGTTVSNATLSINSGASLGDPSGRLTLNNAMLVADANITTPRPITLLGMDTINTNLNIVTLSGMITGSGALIAAGGGTLNLLNIANNYTGGTFVLPGTTVAVPNFMAFGPGPIVLVAPNNTATPVFTGSAHVVGPFEIVNSATPTLFIVPGDTLTGVGSVNINTVVQAFNAPGDGAGTLVFNANVTNTSSSTYNVLIDGPTSSIGCVAINGCAGQYSSIVVNGAGNTFTANGTIAPILRNIGAPANNDYTPPVTTSFLAVYAAGGVLGSFTSLTQPTAGLAPGTRFDALYTPNAITLYVTPSSYQNLSAWNTGLSFNQNQVATALDALRGIAGLRNSPMATTDFALLFAQQPQALPTAFNSLSGEAATGARTAAFYMMNQFLGLMLDPTVNGRNGIAGATGTASAIGFAANDQPAPPLDIAAYANVAPSPKPVPFEQRWNVWGAATGGGMQLKGDPVSAGTHDDSVRGYGFASGADYHFSPDTLAGFALAGGGTNWGLAEGLGGGRSDAFQAGVYAKTFFGPAYFAGSLALANHWMTTDRLAFGGDHLTATFNAQNYGGRLEAGYRIAMPTVSVTPYVAGQAQYFRSPGYSENDLSNGGFALAYSAATASDIRSEIGARFDSVMTPVDGMPLIIRGRAAWVHDWSGNPGLIAEFQAALQPGAMPGAGVGFSVVGTQPSQNIALLSAAAEWRLTPSLSLGAKIDSELSVRSQALSGTAMVRATW